MIGTDHVGTAALGCPVEQGSAFVVLAKGGRGRPSHVVRDARRRKTCGLACPKSKSLTL